MLKPTLKIPFTTGNFKPVRQKSTRILDYQICLHLHPLVSALTLLLLLLSPLSLVLHVLGLRRAEDPPRPVLALGLPCPQLEAGPAQVRHVVGHAADGNPRRDGGGEAHAGVLERKGGNQPMFS